jgi:amidophosphoribosyltransferase
MLCGFAVQVYLASSAPPVRFPNVYGVDMPNRKEFVAHGLTEDQICDVLRADGLVYQDVDDLLEVGKALNPSIKEFDAACFDGHYVTGETANAGIYKSGVEYMRVRDRVHAKHAIK